MTQIKPTYVTFEQARKLKQKECDIKTETIFQYSDEEGWNKVENFPKYYAKGCSHCNRPEQWQVIEWLRVVHGIWVYVFRHDNNQFFWSIDSTQEEFTSDNSFISPQEAYSAAFDYVLNNLI